MSQLKCYCFISDFIPTAHWSNRPHGFPLSCAQTTLRYLFLSTEWGEPHSLLLLAVHLYLSMADLDSHKVRQNQEDMIVKALGQVSYFGKRTQQQINMGKTSVQLWTPLSLSAGSINDSSLHFSLRCRPPASYWRWVKTQGCILQLIREQIL